MVCLTVMYSAAGGTTFDWDYYVSTHLQMSRRLLEPRGMQRLEITRGIAGFPPGTPAQYHAIANLYFNSMAELQGAMEATAAELIADVPHYYSGDSAVQICEVIDSGKS